MSGKEVPITLKPVASGSTKVPLPKHHAAPQPSSTHLKFSYYSPTDGKDDLNLLILFHGLGDSMKPFFDMGKSLKLPSTAVLSIQGPEMVPLMDFPSYMYYPSFTLPDFTPVINPDPRKALTLIASLIQQLISSCGWSLNQIHLFGFGQGGSVASEVALAIQSSTTSSTSQQERLGSLVSVSGPLLSLPTKPTKCETPTLLLYRSSEQEVCQRDLDSFKKGFNQLKLNKFVRGEGMIKGQDEWKIVMKFWSENLTRKETAMGGGGDMYEVVQQNPI